MDRRIEQELALLRGIHPNLRYHDRWALIPQYELPAGWSPAVLDVVFFIRQGFPGVSPYGIYVPAGIRYNGQQPKNYKEPAPQQPPFEGSWGVFSWEAADWRPTANPRNGHNLVNWVQGFAHRFKEGR